MKILYVTGMTIPIKNILTGKTESEISGLPGFFYPWYKMVQKGHEVDFVMISNFKDEYEINVDWFRKENIVANIYAPYNEYKFLRIFRKVRRFMQLLYYTHVATKNKEYDFIYCKVFEGVAGQIVAKLKGIPCGIRLFGDYTFCYPDIIKYGKYMAAIRHPLEFLSFKIGSDFTLATNDNTNCDKLFEVWGSKNKRCSFYHWKTGIDLSPVSFDSNQKVTLEGDYLLFTARFQGWKRHDRIIKVLKELHERNIRINLYFAGAKSSQESFDNLGRLIDAYNLRDYVHYLGEIEKKELKYISSKAVANLFMYDYSNLGNVFFENMSAGSVIVGLNDGSLNEYIVDGENGYLVNDELHASYVIEKLFNDKHLQEKIRKNARITATKKFMSIDERYDMEVELIEKTALS